MGNEERSDSYFQSVSSRVPHDSAVNRPKNISDLTNFVLNLKNEIDAERGERVAWNNEFQRKIGIMEANKLGMFSANELHVVSKLEGLVLDLRKDLEGERRDRLVWNNELQRKMEDAPATKIQPSQIVELNGQIADLRSQTAHVEERESWWTHHAMERISQCQQEFRISHQEVQNDIKEVQNDINLLKVNFQCKSDAPEINEQGRFCLAEVNKLNDQFEVMVAKLKRDMVEHIEANSNRCAKLNEDIIQCQKDPNGSTQRLTGLEQKLRAHDGQIEKIVDKLDKLGCNVELLQSEVHAVIKAGSEDRRELEKMGREICEEHTGENIRTAGVGKLRKKAEEDFQVSIHPVLSDFTSKFVEETIISSFLISECQGGLHKFGQTLSALQGDISKIPGLMKSVKTIRDELDGFTQAAEKLSPCRPSRNRN